MKEAEAVISALLIADTQGSFVTRRISDIQLEFGGIPGDRHFGMVVPSNIRQPMYPRGVDILNRRQITIVSEEQCSSIAERLGIEEVLPEWLGANILFKGFPEVTNLTMGSRILFPSGAGLICMGENQPCTLPGEVIQKYNSHRLKLDKQFVRAAYKRRGIVCAVERPGQIRQGDIVRILINDFSNPMQ